MRGATIIEAVTIEYGVSAHDLLRRRKRGALCAARRDAVLRLWDAGFSLTQIARLLKISQPSVCYHIYPHYRAKAIARRAASRAAA